MSDQNDTQPEETPEETPDLSAVPAPTEPPAEPRSPYLDRAKMLPVEGIVYCLEHTAVHDDTTDPYDYGKPDCDKKEHRPVYYRGRKGDIDESLDDVAVMHGEEGRGTSTDATKVPEGSLIMDDLSGEQDKIKRKIIAQSNAEELTDPERAIVLLLVDHAAKKTEDAAALMHEVWPDDDLVGIRIKLTLLDSVNDKLGGND
jgi:hypothetical protein